MQRRRPPNSPSPVTAPRGMGGVLRKFATEITKMIFCTHLGLLYEIAHSVTHFGFGRTTVLCLEVYCFFLFWNTKEKVFLIFYQK